MICLTHSDWTNTKKMDLFLTPTDFHYGARDTFPVISGQESKQLSAMIRMILTVLSGSARTLDPTNKNYAPELSTFGIIIEVNRSEVQWNSLSLEKLPSWSQLISAPGKYELSGRDFRLSTLCTNCGDPGWGGVDWQIMFLPWQGFKYHIQIKRFDNRQISDNKY